VELLISIGAVPSALYSLGQSIVSSFRFPAASDSSKIVQANAAYLELATTSTRVADPEGRQRRDGV
jgi:hypothetical protein